MKVSEQSYNVVHLLVELVVFAKHKQNDERHVDVMRTPLLRRVQHAQDRYHLNGNNTNISPTNTTALAVLKLATLNLLADRRLFWRGRML